MKYFTRIFQGLILSILNISHSWASGIDIRTLFANTLAKEFYCTVATTMSGTLGVMTGLALSTLGVFKIMMHGPSFGRIFLCTAGLFFTVIPVLFENGMDVMGAIFNSVGSKTTIVSDKFAGTNNACDFGSEGLRPLLIGTTATLQQINDAGIYGEYGSNPEEYLTEVAAMESGGRCHSGTGATCMNQFGCFGLYQFCSGSGIHRTMGYDSWQDFRTAAMGNTALQNAAIKRLHDNNMNYFKRSGVYDKWNGRTITYKGSTFHINETALRKASQMGIGHIQNSFKALENGGSLPTDGNGATMFYWLSNGKVK